MRNPFLINTGFLLLGLLFFIWPIPRTISVREISIFLLFGIFACCSYRTVPLSLRIKGLSYPFVILLMLTAWIMLSAIFISSETAWSLKEIQGQWLVHL